MLKSGTYNFYFSEDGKKKSYRYTGNFARNNCGDYLPDSAGKILYENGDFYEGDISGDWEHLKKTVSVCLKALTEEFQTVILKTTNFTALFKVGIFKTGLNERHGFNRYIVKLKF